MVTAASLISITTFQINLVLKRSTNMGFAQTFLEGLEVIRIQTLLHLFFNFYKHIYLILVNNNLN
jgi:hypothetical protein